MTGSMLLALSLMLGQVAPPALPLGAGDHRRVLTVGGQERTYWVHVPRRYDSTRATPVVLALHGAAMNGKLMEVFSGLTPKSEEAGFIVVYPNGTGPGSILLTWNAGPFFGANKKAPNDVAFMGKLLDDLGTVLNVDTKRVYATGMSNGGMMSYRLAAEMADRIAAIAPVAGTMAMDKAQPSRPVPLIHFHGTADALVDYNGPDPEAAKLLRFRSVADTIATWTKIDRCEAEPTITELPCKADKLKVIRKAYAPQAGGAPVVLYTIEGGGHTWPGQQRHAAFLGESTANISANDLMWEFFQRAVLP